MQFLNNEKEKGKQYKETQKAIQEVNEINRMH